MGRPVILPVVAPEDFEAFRELLNADFPDTYDEWLQLRAKWQAKAREDGFAILEVKVNPDEFAGYLNSTSGANDIASLCAFAEAVSDGNEN